VFCDQSSHALPTMCTSKTIEYDVKRKKRARGHFPRWKDRAARLRSAGGVAHGAWIGRKALMVMRGEADSMSAFYRSGSGRPGRLAPLFPQRINKTRSSQGIGDAIILLSPRQRLRASLICSLISQSGKAKLGELQSAHGVHGSARILFIYFMITGVGLMYSRHKPQGSCLACQ
jgi:hypothetical protein